MRRYVENIDREWMIEPDKPRLQEALEILNHNFNLALPILTELSNSGSRMSMVYIGDAYLYGRGVKENHPKGEKWLAEAVSLGSIEAAYLLARHFERLKLFDKSRALLFDLIKRRYSPSMYLMGSFYYHGEGVERNLDEALKYWKMAESEGHLVAKHWIIWVYRKEKMGFAYKFSALARFFRFVVPYIVTKVRFPRSDRLRNW
jgi:TPR repeat protein